MKRLQRLEVINPTLFIFWISILILFSISGEIGASLFNLSPEFLLLDLGIIGISLLAIPYGIIQTIVNKRYVFILISSMNLMIVILAIGIAMVIPHKTIIEGMRGKPKVVAIYKGTMNESVLTLRDNNNFDIWSIGWFAMNDYRKGTYERNGDSLMFRFSGPPPHGFNGKGEIVRNKTWKPFVRFYRYQDTMNINNYHNYPLDYFITEEY